MVKKTVPQHGIEHGSRDAAVGSATGASLSGKTAMIVDDEPMARRIVFKHLTAFAMDRIEVAENGRAALGLLGAGDHPDLILCDLSMPEMDGIEFLRHLSELGFEGGVVLMSAEDERVLRSVRRLAGTHRLNVLGVMAKPVRRHFLTNLLVEYFEGKKLHLDGNVAQKISPEALAEAIAEDRIVNVYQPKVLLAENRIAGVETLARLRGKDGTLMSPATFIPVAEEHGLIDRLTQAVFEQALRDVSEWDEAGHDLDFSVNFPIDSLRSTAITDSLLGQLTEHGIFAERFIIEVTESQALENASAPLEILTRLRLKGVCLSIDDFGTGYSSLSQLSNIPFQEIKLDQSFVSKALNDSTARSIVESTTSMAKSMGLKIVAEGIEDAETATFIASLGVDQAQGYYFARPLLRDDLMAFLKKF